MSDGQNSKGPLQVLKVIGIIFGIFAVLAFLSAIFNRDYHAGGGSSLVKKFRKKIGMCCLIVGLALAVPLTGLVKNYI